MAGAVSPSTSPTLLELLGVPGNDAAWTKFLDLYGPRIDRACRSASLQAADADEVRSRVLTALVTAMKGFKYDPARRFRGYLATAVTNAIRGIWRERMRRLGCENERQSIDALIDLPSPIDELGDELDADIHRRLQLARRAMNAVRNRVDPVTWDAFWRTAIEGEPAIDVAASLGKKVGAVYMARCRVQQMLNEQGRLLIERKDDDSERDE